MYARDKTPDLSLTRHKHPNLISLHAVSRLKIATNFPLSSTSSVAQIAKSCNLHEEDTRRIIRHAITNRIFRESDEGVIAHTAASRAIAEVPLLREWIDESCTNMWSSAPHVVAAIAKWPGSEEPNETAFNLARNTGDSFFETISRNEEDSKRFADALTFFQAGPGMETSIVVDNYDWEAHGSGIVVDVGGLRGVVALMLAEKFPAMRCIVQDLPEVIAGAPALTNADLAARVQFQAHDFYTKQPVKGADVYFFRMIFHN
jgi:hypothetical protein